MLSLPNSLNLWDVASLVVYACVAKEAKNVNKDTSNRFSWLFNQSCSLGVVRQTRFDNDHLENCVYKLQKNGLIL